MLKKLLMVLGLVFVLNFAWNFGKGVIIGLNNQYMNAVNEVLDENGYGFISNGQFEASDFDAYDNTSVYYKKTLGIIHDVRIERTTPNGTKYNIWVDRDGTQHNEVIEEL